MVANIGAKFCGKTVGISSGRIGSELHDKQSPFGRKTFSGRKSRRKDVFVKAV